jgi:YHS domain-containing protein
MVKDPVCGKTFDVREATVAARHRGRYLYFCSMSCKAAFELTPLLYLGPRSPRPQTRATPRHRRAA